jgi:hypothetical protein
MNYRTAELMSLTVNPKYFDEGRQILREIFDLSFPWARQEIEAEEERKRQEFIEMAKKMMNKEE